MIARNRSRPKLPYVVVYNHEIVRYGADAAILLAELRFLSDTHKKDHHGYFGVEKKYLQTMLGFKKDKLFSTREKLRKLGKIDYIQGSNQNAKTRYKIVL